MRLGSLFDGSGGFPLAASMCGIRPVWASEVEPYPIAVTKSRLPEMAHLGNIRDVHGGEIEPVDIITFGSPCQDMSIAGKRAGMKHKENTRSGLFMEAIRIIKEMRGATNGEYPRFAIWENVPGAFSSSKGEDFRLALQELIKIVETQAAMPQVPKAGWPRADSYRGDGWSLAYRVFDAQYWGVPQRRRRIFLVADFGGTSAEKILFEREGLQKNLEQGRKGAGYAEKSTGKSDSLDAKLILDRRGRQTHCRPGEASSTRVVENAGFAEDHGPKYGSIGYREEQSPTLTASGGAAVCTTTETRMDVQNTTGWKGLVRHVTPTECARLQGFPDWWGTPEYKESFTEEEYNFWLEVRSTHAKINGKQVKEYSKESMLKWYSKLHTDSAEYKMWGNGIALPCALYVMEGITENADRPRN